MKIAGTIDEMLPQLQAAGFTGVRTMAGVVPLASFDPYGMARLGSVNIQSERWAHHIWRGVVVESGDRSFLADATPDGELRRPTPPFVGGLFPLVKGESE